MILADRGRSSRPDCLISTLPYNVRQYIVQFMGRGGFFMEKGNQFVAEDGEKIVEEFSQLSDAAGSDREFEIEEIE